MSLKLDTCRFRVLDTRSKFILLHDYRLFSKRLHYIWKRIVNVIFVKENDYSRRGNLSTGTWFEITTVPFPLPIKEVYVDKKLDSWRSGRYQRGTKLFENKLLNLNSLFNWWFSNGYIFNMPNFR